jgi:threonine dehydrogenase-like Zn-dependent dehydrogenase
MEGAFISITTTSVMKDRRCSRVNGSDWVTPGQRVGVNIMQGCGKCVYCLSGDPVHCSQVKLSFDAHSDYVVVPASTLVPLPDDVDWDTAVLMCGDTLGTPYHALKRLGGVDASQRAAVFGFGPIGIGCLVWLKYFGLYTIVSEVSPYRRELAKRLGADLVLDPTKEDVVGHVQGVDRRWGRNFLDCAGVPKTLNAALTPRIMGGWVSLPRNLPPPSPSEQFIRRSSTIAGSWYFTTAEFYEQVELYRRGLSVKGLLPIASAWMKPLKPTACLSPVRRAKSFLS